MEATICRIVTHPSSYDGELVRVRAYFAGSFEGSYLVDDKCGKGIWFTTSDGVRSLAVILVHNPYPDVPEPDFSLVKDKEYEKFTTFAYSIGGKHGARIQSDSYVCRANRPLPGIQAQ